MFQYSIDIILYLYFFALLFMIVLDNILSQSGTQQIIISTEAALPHHDARENQVLMWMTHSKPYYIPYNYLDSSFQSTLLLAATEAMPTKQ